MNGHADKQHNGSPERGRSIPNMEGTAELSCADFVELATEYLEDALPEQDRVRFEEHLSECEDCRVFLDQLKETLRLVGRLDESAMSPEAETTLLEAFRTWHQGR